MTTYAGKRSWLPDTVTSPVSLPEAAHASTTEGARLNALIDSSNISQIVSKQGTCPKRPRLTQSTIDLGSGPQKTCSKCSMQYMPAATQDLRAHAKYCATIDEASIGIRVLRKEFECCRMVRSLPSRKVGSTVGAHSTTISDKKSSVRDHILEVTRRSNPKARILAERVLRVVECELGSIKMNESKIWSMVEDPSPAPGTGVEATKHDAFKAYLYIANSRCVGLCLTQRIWKARKVSWSCVAGFADADTDRDQTQGMVGKDIDGANSSSYYADGVAVDTVVLGISRIWVAPCARSKGIAKDLLDVAQNWFLAGRTLSKGEVAFSQPTESGLRLARKWHGAGSGWCVYDERIENL